MRFLEYFNEVVYVVVFILKLWFLKLFGLRLINFIVDFKWEEIFEYEIGRVLFVWNNGLVEWFEYCKYLNRVCIG